MRGRAPRPGAWRVLVAALAGIVLAPLLARAEIGPTPADFESARVELREATEGSDARRLRALAADFRAYAHGHPESERAAEALWLAAGAARRVAHRSYEVDDARAAARCYRDLVDRHADDAHAPEALLEVARLELGLLGDPRAGRRSLKRLVTSYPTHPSADTALELLLELDSSGIADAPAVGDEPGTRPGVLVGVRHWVGVGGVQLILDLEGAAELRSTWLADPASATGRSTLRLELEGVRVAADLGAVLDEPDGMLVGLSVLERGSLGTVVSADVVGAADYEVFTTGERVTVLVHAAQRPEGAGPRIVIDPGHGGKDPGASGPSKRAEKHVVLEIAKALEGELRERLGATVVLTRRSDVFMPLEERAAIANVNAADLFVSVHANAHRSRKIRGIETYFLAPATGDRAREVAARENGLIDGGAADGVALDAVLSILNDLAVQRSVERSSHLARAVHAALLEDLVDPRRPLTEDLGVKQAPFLVLVGAEMPSVLVEVGFLTHPEEGRRLGSSGYQRRLSRAMAEGIERFLAGSPVARVER